MTDELTPYEKLNLNAAMLRYDAPEQRAVALALTAKAGATPALSPGVPPPLRRSAGRRTRALHRRCGP